LFPNLLANGAIGHRGRHGDVDPAAQRAELIDAALT
jgi:hypothetical protein